MLSTALPSLHIAQAPTDTRKWSKETSKDNELSGDLGLTYHSSPLENQ